MGCLLWSFELEVGWLFGCLVLDPNLGSAKFRLPFLVVILGRVADEGEHVWTFLARVPRIDPTVGTWSEAAIGLQVLK